VNEYDPATLAFYANEAPVYAASTPDGVARHLPDFLARLQPGARILELGCGGGRDAHFMLQLGFDVDATDGTAEIAVQAEQRLGRPVRVMRFDMLESVAEYDAVVATYSLLHVPRGGLPGILRRIWTALKPGGWHIASYKSGDAEGRDRFGRYFNYLNADKLRAAYSTAGDWAETDIRSAMGGGYDGVQGLRHFVTVRKQLN
jgi:2-polyprenyl-3-methyl-5-hydroxy-6-metoxy-1,4-benzoquinol methylase